MENITFNLVVVILLRVPKTFATRRAEPDPDQRQGLAVEQSETVPNNETPKIILRGPTD